MLIRMRIAALPVLLALTACPGPSGDCDQDWECAGGQVCANNHACVPEGSTYRLTVAWTMDGYPAGPDTCAPVDHLELLVEDTVSGDYAQYAPVPCEGGRFTFLKLPGGYDRTGLAVIAGGRRVEDHVAPISASTGTVSFDLATAGPPPDVDAGPVVDAAPIVDAGVDAGVAD